MRRERYKIGKGIWIWSCRAFRVLACVYSSRHSLPFIHVHSGSTGSFGQGYFAGSLLLGRLVFSTRWFQELGSIAPGWLQLPPADRTSAHLGHWTQSGRYQRATGRGQMGGGEYSSISTGLGKGVLTSCPVDIVSVVLDSGLLTVVQGYQA